MNLIRTMLLGFMVLWISGDLQATHNRAGDITYVQIGPLRIRMTVTTYTKASSTGADRDSVRVFWGDGQMQYVYRVNGPLGKGEILENDTKRNYYVAEHTYPGIGSYTINMTDPNRVGNILNLNFPNSVAVQFHLATTLTLLNSTIQGYNNSVVLLQPPIDFGCIGKKFVHNINAYDPDGDSLSYELIVPLQATGTEVPNYRYPDQIVPGGDNKISLDKTNGSFTWLAPQKEGEYNIAILIKEYRNGILLNSIIRDMQITILNCSNEPPELIIPKDLCVVAGQKVAFNVSAVDKNSTDKIKISALGGPFTLAINKATFAAPSGFQNQPASAQFTWQTSCEHISDVPYSVVFRAVDNFKDSTGTADLKAIKIKVIGPAPENLSISTTANTNEAKLSWTYPNSCAVTANNYFKGFSVWRRVNSNPFNVDTCSPGLTGKGYVKIASNVRTTMGGTYMYIDDLLDAANTYCYRILAEFALTSPGGNSYNRVTSLPSNEACIQLRRDLPFITKTSVNSTSNGQGSILLNWVMPVATDLDTLKRPGPYKIEIQRAPGLNGTNFVNIPGAIFTSQTFAGFTDTSYLDQNLNTGSEAYTYRLVFYSSAALIPYGYSLAASSIYLRGVATDRTVSLTWDKQVPWTNFKYDIWRAENNNVFSVVGSSSQQAYKDIRLQNDVRYCYKVFSTGSYGITGLTNVITNFSQEICLTPIDTTPPCKPTLSILRNCVLKDSKGLVTNELAWSYAATDTCFIDDIKSINIYYSKTKALQAFTKIGTVTDLTTKTFNHTPDSGYTGCYLVTATDFKNNENKLIGEICPALCQIDYVLPNAFSPNDDNQNERFKPLSNSGVLQVNFEVFNRWGELLYQTKDPLINWDGKDKKGKDLAAGVYYYKCRLIGVQENNQQSSEDRKGFIQLIR